MDTLLIFIKNPVKGKVKTRIAQTAGEERALQIYLELLRHTREVALLTTARRLLFYSDFIDENDAWSSSDFQKMVQHGSDLGERMNNAFRLGLVQPDDRSVIIGSDCAALSHEIIATAFAQLENHPFVIGPATDGGYYLLGMRQHTPELFRDIAWSTEAVMPATLQRIKYLGATYYMLPELSDVDFESDWEREGWL